MYDGFEKWGGRLKGGSTPKRRDARGGDTTEPMAERSMGAQSPRRSRPVLEYWHYNNQKPHQQPNGATNLTKQLTLVKRERELIKSKDEINTKKVSTAIHS